METFGDSLMHQSSSIVKSIRSKATIQDGGLTPIEDETSTIQIHSPSTTSLQELNERETRARSMTEDIIQQVLENREKWKYNARQGVEAPPFETGKAITAHETALMKINLQHELSEPDLAKIVKGMNSILKLDEILQETDLVARELKYRRKSRESSATSLSVQNQTFDYDPKDEDSKSDEFSSMYSSILGSYKSISDRRSSRSSSSTTSSQLSSELDFDMRTFLTEARIGRRKHSPKVWLQKPAVESLTREFNGNSRRNNPSHIGLRGYKRGDFIERNRILGGDARYYDALTEEEKHRVEMILEIPDTELGFEHIAADNPGFSVSSQDINILDDIDKSLQDLVPQSQWLSKSISSAGSSGTRTPLSLINDHVSKGHDGKCRDVESVMGDFKTITEAKVVLKDELQQLLEIDEKLRILRNEYVEDSPLSRDVLDQLLWECQEIAADAA